MALAGKSQRPRREKNDAEKPVIARTAYDLQRLKLEKLMKNAVCNSDVLFVLSNLNSTYCAYRVVAVFYTNDIDRNDSQVLL
jgi:hypothetical protein